MIAVAYRILGAAQHDAARAGTKHGALRAMVKSVAMAVGREDLALGEQIAAGMGQFDGHAARQGHVAFAIKQGLRGDMHRDQTGGTGRLHVDRRAFQVEHMAHTGGQKVLVVPGVAQQEHAGLVDQIAVRTEVEIEIAAHAAPGIDTHRTGEVFGRMARILQRLPRHLQELAVLGVEDGGLFRRKAKELGVELRKAVQHGSRGDIVGLGHPRRAFAGGQQLFTRQNTD